MPGTKSCITVPQTLLLKYRRGCARQTRLRAGRCGHASLIMCCAVLNNCPDSVEKTLSVCYRLIRADLYITNIIL